MLYVVFLQWVFTELGLPIAGSINAYGLNFSVEPRLSLYLGSYIADALCFAAIYPVVAPIVYQVKRDLLAASGPK